MAFEISNALRSLLDAKVHSIATCWKLERTDGEILRFTDCDKLLTIEGETYTPMNSLSATARQSLSGFKEDNLEAVGIISDDAITHDDLQAGKYYEAKITETIVDHRHPWAGIYGRNVYWLTESKFSDNRWEGKLEGLGRWLRPKVGDMYTHECRHELGDSICRVNLSSIEESGAVFLVDTDPLLARAKFECTGLTKGSGYFSFGRLTWTSGANNGQIVNVKESLFGPPYTIELQLPALYAIEPNDTFDIVAGCDKLRTTCKNKFNNFVNFGGFPFIPGRDKTLQVPSVR